MSPPLLPPNVWRSNFLGETISFLTDHGAIILDVEIEKPTLLDVLESYE